jgi:hypothetical protein
LNDKGVTRARSEDDSETHGNRELRAIQVLPHLATCQAWGRPHCTSLQASKRTVTRSELRLYSSHFKSLHKNSFNHKKLWGQPRFVSFIFSIKESPSLLSSSRCLYVLLMQKWWKLLLCFTCMMFYMTLLFALYYKELKLTKFCLFLLWRLNDYFLDSHTLCCSLI